MELGKMEMLYYLSSYILDIVLLALFFVPPIMLVMTTDKFLNLQMKRIIELRDTKLIEKPRNYTVINRHY